MISENRINTDFAEGFKLRTKRQAVAITKFLRTIKSNDEVTIIKKQLIRSAFSTAANYRATCRAKSKADFISKLGIVHEEADETVFWLEVIEELDHNSKDLTKLKGESEEILKVVAKSISTSRTNHYNKN
jgi:four helix bundle protein